MINSNCTTKEYYLSILKWKMTSMSGEFYDTENASATPSISKETAFKKAINHIGASKYLWENPENALKIGYHKPGELVFFHQ
jgi:hypothetical protein